jgi:hypothetical protein
MASRTETVAVAYGARKTMLVGFMILSCSLLLYGPSPLLSHALRTEGAAKGAISVGMLVFQVSYYQQYVYCCCDASGALLLRSCW